ncbi:hypothetical protein [Dechloromonas sp. H13]|uniref:hypothetical protein n=1 Tax=Dechloromonas sp. H13 TaxID=2570193 RepID=UPI001290FB27|nr:hypothetical protein [Dechloromonas sp. H13]
MHFPRVLLALALSLPLAACAPDAWRPDSPYDAFLAQVQNKCWNLDIGGREINSLLNDQGDAATGAYFLDLTSRYFNGRISRENYVEALSTSYNTRPDSPGIRCVLEQMPSDPQRLAPLIKQ